MDLISFSPSLLPILSLLNRKEIALCRRLSRRFCETITSNRRIAPRRPICVEIKRIVKIPYMEYVLVDFARSFGELCYFRVSIRIDNQSISVVKCSDTELFKYSFKGSIIDGLAVGSIVEGIQIVLQPLLLRYNFKIFNLIDLRSPGNVFCSTIMDTYKRTHGYLEMFHKLIWPHVNHLLVSTGTLHTSAPSRMPKHWPKNLHKEGIMCNQASIGETVPALRELFKGWYEGRYRIFRIRLYDRSRVNDMPSLYRQIAASFGSECEWEAFHRIYSFSKTRFGIREHSPIHDVVFRRPRDDVILCISNHQHQHNLYIYDHPHSGPLADFKFFYSQYCSST